MIDSASFKMLAVGALTACISLLGCSSSSNDTGSSQNGECTSYTPPAGSDLTKATSFRNDVVPLFAQDCARSACHSANGGASNRGITLDGDSAAIRTALLQTSTESTLAYVSPGDPSNSYMQHKIDGDLCTIKTACGGDCLDTMPQAESLLAESDRLVIRRWITQGAPDN